LRKRRKTGGKGGGGASVTDHEFGTSAAKSRALELATLMSRLKLRPTKILEISDRHEETEEIKLVKVLEEAKEAEQARKLAC
jgi:hypothetical protein